MTRLIDADALKKAFDFDDDVELECAVVQFGIDNAPTVDPVKHGHWENVPLWAGSDKRILFRCSKCMGPSWTETAYCSNCGSKMDEVTE